MMIDRDAGTLLKAILFAAEKHRDQRRKDEPHTPYVNHPIQVAEILWRVGDVRDEATLLAAILHDTIEDTPTTADEIGSRFGKEVVTLVLEVTDDKSLPKEERKRLQVEHAPELTSKAKLIKLADKICNLRDLLDSPPAGWPLSRRQEYLLWTEKVVRGLRGTNPDLEGLYDQILFDGRHRLHVK